MDFKVEPGEFNVMVGNSSDNNDLTNLQLMVENNIDKTINRFLHNYGKISLFI